MEKIIFFSLAIPILIFVIYLGGGAIIKGFSAKVSNRPNKTESEKQNFLDNSSNDVNQLSDELNKLNELLENGILTKEEFEQAKRKVLEK